MHGYSHMIYLFVYVRFEGFAFKMQVGFIFKIQEGLAVFDHVLNAWYLAIED
jgi:hypothetical protein